MDLLTILLLIPGITLVLLFLARGQQTVRKIAMAGGAVQLLYTIFLAYCFIQEKMTAGNISGLLFTDSFNWFEPLNINFSYGIDGISLLMILLTALVVFSGILVSGNIREQSKEFYVLLTLLGFGAYGFFIATDLFMLFFFLEIAVIPKYLLIGIWGSGAHEKNAMKLALMLMGGSALVFIGIVMLYFFNGDVSGHFTWNLQELAQTHLPAYYQRPLYLLTFIGFGVFSSLSFPFLGSGRSLVGTNCRLYVSGRCFHEVGRIRMSAGSHLPVSRSSRRIIMDIYHSRFNRYPIRGYRYLKTKRPEVYECFLICQPLRICHLRYCNAYSHGYHGSSDANGFTWSNDSPLLRCDRYDLPTYAYPADQRTGRSTLSSSVHRFRLPDRRTLLTGVAGDERFRFRDDDLCRFLGTGWDFLPGRNFNSLLIYRDYGRIYSAGSRLGYLGRSTQ